MEVSSIGVEQERVAGLKFKVGIFSNPDSLAAHIVRIAHTNIQAVLATLHVRDVKDVIHQRAQQIRIALDDDAILCNLLL